MFDLGDLRILFKPGYVECGQKEDYGYLIPTFQDLGLYANESKDDKGVVYRSTHNGYDNPFHSSISSVYFRVHNRGTKNFPFPFVQLIASPAKIIQGHNVFGSDNIELGWLMMLKLLSDKKPHIFDMLDILGTSINAIDINYSVDYGNEHIGGQIINFLSNVSDGQVRATRNINSETCYWNKSSKIDGKQVNFGQLVERKAYRKYSELLYYVKKVHQMNLPKDVIQNIVKINTDSKLLDHAKTKLRWEAKIKAKYLKNHYGTNLVADIIQIQKEYKRAGKSLTIELFDYAFKRIFKAVGDNKMIIKDYETIKIKLADKGFKTREVNEAVKMYGLFTYFGWHEAKTMYSKVTFYKYLKILISVIPKAQLQNLNSQYDGNVIPMMNFVELNFDNQYPDWYKEPTLDSLGLTDFANRIYENKPILRVV